MLLQEEQSVLSFIDRIKDNRQAMDQFISKIDNTRNGSKSPFKSNKFTPANYSTQQHGETKSSKQSKSVGRQRIDTNIDLGKRLNPKEYFQKFIREQNKTYIQRQRRLTIDSNQYIVYDRHNKQSFQEKVSHYMKSIEKEEESIQENSSKFINIFDEEQNNAKKEEEQYHQIVEQLDLTNKHDKESLMGSQLPKIKEDTFTHDPLAILGGSVEHTSKKVPRYMQANVAWLSKNKANGGGIPSDLLKDQSTNYLKSRKSSIFPQLKKKRVEGGSDDMFTANDLAQGKAVKQIPKYYQINREDPLIIDLFKKICQEKRDTHIQRARLTKGKLKAHLSKKYKGKMAEKILSFFDIQMPLEFNQYIDLLEKMLNFTQDKVKRMAFNVFDFNEDKFICQLDLYSLMKMYEGDDHVFVNAYSYDICKLICFLDSKMNSKGNQNYELNQKLKLIQKKVEQAMKHNFAHVVEKSQKSKSKHSSHALSSGNVSQQLSDQEEEEDEDDDSFYNDIEDDEKTAKFSNKTPATKSHKNGLSRRNSTVSRKNLPQDQQLKRMNTMLSRTSRVSRGSGKSGVSTFSRKKSRASFFSHYQEPEEEENQEHPFDAIFGKDIYKKMKDNRDYNEKMSFAEYKTVQWDFNFPQFTIDLINYISCFQISDYIKSKKQKEQEDKEQEEFQSIMQKKKEQGENIDEKSMLDIFKRSKMTEDDTELSNLRIRIGNRFYKKFLRFFKNVARNPAEPKDSMLFLTQESIFKKLKNHFGHKCEFLSLRIYNVLADNVNLRRVYFKEFVEKIYTILWEGTAREQMRFAFAILDIDHDGLLNGPDLLTTQENIDLNSEYGQELLILIDHYVHTHLLCKDRVNPKYFMHCENYINMIGKSCLIDELKVKILAKPSKYHDKSVFFKGTQEQLENKRQRGNLHKEGAPKRAILMWEGLNALKEKKKVTFALYTNFNPQI